MAIDVLTKEEIINALTPSTYPHLKEDRRKKVYNDLRRELLSKLDQSGAAVKSYQDVISNLKRKIGRG